jgi:hypothetical protein
MVLEPYGTLSKCEMLQSQAREALSLPRATLVEFTRFDPSRDLSTVRTISFLSVRDLLYLLIINR